MIKVIPPILVNSHAFTLLSHPTAKPLPFSTANSPAAALRCPPAAAHARAAAMPIKFRPNDIKYLKKKVVRQNWSTVTLFNLTRMTRQRTTDRTFFQQKWTAKQETRRYHGEHLTKRQWQNIFKHSLKSVVPLNNNDLALSDGSEHAAGRGSGLVSTGLAAKTRKPLPTPYMSQTYAPMERRLDIAIFRAMFASSALQARQFVIHGWVKVNGKKMQHPQYMLNPGDMFSVDIEKVLFATGAPKGLPRSQDPRFVNRKKEGGAEEAAEEGSETKAEVVEATAAKAEVVEATAAKAEVKATGTEAVAAEGEEAAVTKEFNKERELAGGRDWWSDVNRSRLFDPTKPYRTPWRPRYYLSAFAFIPRYMEVNHSIGHAVYLRDPVARPGLSEIPSPFTHETMQLAYNWFLRRR